MNKHLSPTTIAVALGVAAALALAVFWLRPQESVEDQMREVLYKNAGESRPDMERLIPLSEKVTKYRQNLSEKEWQSLVALAGNESPNVSQLAWGSLSIATGRKLTDHQQDAYRMIDGLKADPAHPLHTAYIHYAGLARKPGWREEAQTLTTNADPNVRRRAKAVLEVVESD